MANAVPFPHSRKIIKKLNSPITNSNSDEALTSPASLRNRAEKLLWLREDKTKKQKSLTLEIEQIEKYLAIADGVSEALQVLSEQLFREVLDVLQSKLSFALQDVLEQPSVQFKANADFKRGSAVVEFSIERDGNVEDIKRGQGGSVHNILSVGLRLFALATLDEKTHRRFLVLDEQDCWLRPELVPKLVKIIHQAARELGFQVLLISHHDVSLFEQYADRIYRLAPQGDKVKVIRVNPDANELDSE